MKVKNSKRDEVYIVLRKDEEKGFVEGLERCINHCPNGNPFFAELKKLYILLLKNQTGADDV